jgi:hypothetical protein
MPAGSFGARKSVERLPKPLLFLASHLAATGWPGAVPSLIRPPARGAGPCFLRPLRELPLGASGPREVRARRFTPGLNCLVPYIWLISLSKAEAFSRSKSRSPVPALAKRCSAISSADADLRFENLGSARTSSNARLKIAIVAASYC